MEEDAKTCEFLKDPLSLSDLIESGVKFEINSNFDNELSVNNLFDELHAGSDEEDDTELNKDDLVSPWTKPFNELRQQMVKIDEYMYKKITKTGKTEGETVPLNARVCIRYNAYWEGEGAPFDSSFLRGSSFSFYTGRNEVLEGLEQAVRTMYCGEQAQFLMSYHLLFHEMGCPPRVKPKADGLFIVELISFNAVGDVNAEQQVPEEDRGKYSVIIDKVKDIHLKGLDFFKQGLYRNAARAFEKASSLLTFCRLANEEEEKGQTAFLIKLYTNLAVCYNKVNSPAKTCIMCKDIRRLTNNSPSCKAIFLEGRALLMLGEYERARQMLTQAQHMEPHNEDINKELKTLEHRYSRYKENARNMWTQALGITNKDIAKASADSAGHSKFEIEMNEVMQSFKDNLHCQTMKLPSGLTENEIDTVDTLAKTMDLKLTLSPLDNTTYTLTKT